MAMGSHWVRLLLIEAVEIGGMEEVLLIPPTSCLKFGSTTLCNYLTFLAHPCLTPHWGTEKQDRKAWTFSPYALSSNFFILFFQGFIGLYILVFPRLAFPGFCSGNLFPESSSLALCSQACEYLSTPYKKTWWRRSHCGTWRILELRHPEVIQSLPPSSANSFILDELIFQFLMPLDEPKNQPTQPL